MVVDCSVMKWECMTAQELVPDGVIADKSSRMNSEVLKAILSGDIQPKCCRTHWMVLDR